jgi:hypothetical protein
MIASTSNQTPAPINENEVIENNAQPLPVAQPRNFFNRRVVPSLTSAGNVLGSITGRIARNIGDRFSSQRPSYTVAPDADQEVLIVEQALEAPLSEPLRTASEIADIYHSSKDSLESLSNHLQELAELYPEEKRTPEDTAIIEMAITSQQQLKNAVNDYSVAVRAGLRTSSTAHSSRDYREPFMRTNHAAGLLEEAVKKTSPHLETLENLCERFIAPATIAEIPTGRATSLNHLPQEQVEQLPQAYKI